MSTSLAGGNANRRKQTCRNCGNTVYVVTIDGVTLTTDPELVSVITHGGPPQKIHARALHDEITCQRRKLEREKREWKAAQRKREALDRFTKAGK